jgi:DNA-binding transcriptional ArsR family regulator
VYVHPREAVLAAVTNPQRRVLLDALLERPQTVGELIHLVPIAQSGVSRHLGILRNAGLPAVKSDAQRRIYALRAEPLEELSE